MLPFHEQMTCRDVECEQCRRAIEDKIRRDDRTVVLCLLGTAAALGLLFWLLVNFA